MPPRPQYVHELSASVKLLESQSANLRQQTANLEVKYEGIKDSLETLRREVAVINQQVSELKKRTDEWERRWWGILMVMVGALLSLAAGLIVTLVRN